jgi:hypothetical protein
MRQGSLHVISAGSLAEYAARRHGIKAERSLTLRARRGRVLHLYDPVEGTAGSAFSWPAALKSAGDNAQSEAATGKHEDTHGNPHPIVVSELVAGFEHCSEDLKHGLSPNYG